MKLFQDKFSIYKKAGIYMYELKGKTKEMAYKLEKMAEKLNLKTRVMNPLRFAWEVI